ncbi:hypothetical protein PCAR4_750060 [Paraburkholderia caribensis]|nr:hypothetical protein PCAR4_750060 [Paraburkholderia caribensis]
MKYKPQTAEAAQVSPSVADKKTHSDPR